MTPDTPLDIPPEFFPNVPAPLLEKLPPKDRWLYERMSVIERQNNWIVEHQVKADRWRRAADERTARVEGRVLLLEELKITLTAKWSIVFLIFVCIISPIVFSFLGVWLQYRF